MNACEHVRHVLDMKMSIDRLPMVEWAAWWDVTLDRWHSEGLPVSGFIQSQRDFGLGPMVEIRAGARTHRLPQPDTFGGPIIRPDRTCDEILPQLYDEELVESVLERARGLTTLHGSGEVIIRVTLEGFFWFARTLLGIEPHFYAFYDDPELLHRIHADLASFNIRVADAICPVLKPEFLGLAEERSGGCIPSVDHQTPPGVSLDNYRTNIRLFAEYARMAAAG